MLELEDLEYMQVAPQSGRLDPQPIQVHEQWFLARLFEKSNLDFEVVVQQIRKEMDDEEFHNLPNSDVCSCKFEACGGCDLCHIDALFRLECQEHCSEEQSGDDLGYILFCAAEASQWEEWKDCAGGTWCNLYRGLWTRCKGQLQRQ